MCLHAAADDRDFRDVGPMAYGARVEFLRSFFGRSQSFCKVVLRDREGNFCQAFGPDILHHHINGDFALCQFGKYQPHHSGAIRNCAQRDPRFILDQGDTSDHGGRIV